MKNGDYITILSPMVSKLKLNGNNLLVFALIHGYSKDGEHAFYGSISYISSWLNISKNSVIDTLKVLTDSGLLKKDEEIRNGVKFCNYKSQYDSILKKLDSGCETAPVVAKKKRGGCKSQQGSCETGHNNNKDININIDNIKEHTIVCKKENNAEACASPCAEPCADTNASPCVKSIADEWRHDYDAYKQLVCSAAETLKADVEFKEKQEMYFPNVNFELSIDKGCDYWLSEQGYRKCKAAKTKISMLARLKNNFDKNRIYYQQGVKPKADMLNTQPKDTVVINGTEYK